MQVFTLLIAIAFSLFATVIMSYISMATGIGPWVETTLALAGMLLFSGLRSWYSKDERGKAIGLTTAAGGIAGILATACGFSFATYYFLDPIGFAQLLADPWRFALILGLLALSAGSLGLLTAQYFEHTLLDQQQLSFAIGELVYKMIMAADNLQKALSLALGFVSTQVYLLIRSFIPLLRYPLVLTNKIGLGVITIPRIAILTDQLPMYWAIGFVTGHVIAMPLLVGMLVKIAIIGPLYYIYPMISTLTCGCYVPRELSMLDFTIAFSSGLVLYGAAKGFLTLPATFKKTIDRLSAGKSVVNGQFPWYGAAGVGLLHSVALSYLEFSWLSQLYLVIFSIICTYQLMLLAGKFGLAPLGRFATFVMVPGMLIFGYTPLQTTFVAAYVEIAGGVAADALFGRKMARLASIDRATITGYQWLGLLVSVLSIGVIFYLFISHFGLGSQEGALAVTRSASRALLISVKTFEIGALLLGVLSAYLISYLGINTSLLLFGILMPISSTLLLVLGGLSTYLVEDKEEYYPFWSGVFAANSLWMLVQAFM